jgi:pimeloyl-ACP methyl ester carboxylesterase
MAPAARAASVDGATIHWTSSGSGRQTLILVHGWTCDESSWKEQVPALSKSYRIVTLDLPGHGKSGMPKAFSMELFARAIEAVRAEAKIDRALLVGHSMGTPVIRKYALMYPERVAGLVIVDGLVQLSANAVQPGQPGRGPLPAVTLQTREAMVKGMFGPATTSRPAESHPEDDDGALREATAAGAMAATWDTSQVVRSEDHGSGPCGFRPAPELWRRNRRSRRCTRTRNPHIPRRAAFPDDGRSR